jgi:A/G-specific adenine glycosylase
LARVFGIFTPIDSSAGKKDFTALADKLLDKKYPGLYNQAIMDFGAIICKPAPLCDQCPFSKNCFALLHKKINELPVKEKKISVRKRWFYYLVMDYKGQVAIQQRTGNDIWQQLYQFPVIEAIKETGVEAVLTLAEKNGLLEKENADIVSVSPLYKQLLSHQLITGKFITIKLKRKPAFKNDWLWSPVNKLNKYAFPKFINQYRSVDKVNA